MIAQRKQCLKSPGRLDKEVKDKWEVSLEKSFRQTLVNHIEEFGQS